MVLAGLLSADWQCTKASVCMEKMMNKMCCSNSIRYLIKLKLFFSLKLALYLDKIWSLSGQMNGASHLPFKSRPPMGRFGCIEHHHSSHRMRRQPYKWAVVNGTFCIDEPQTTIKINRPPTSSWWQAERTRLVNQLSWWFQSRALIFGFASDIWSSACRQNTQLFLFPQLGTPPNWLKSQPSKTKHACQDQPKSCIKKWFSCLAQKSNYKLMVLFHFNTNMNTLASFILEARKHAFNRSVDHANLAGRTPEIGRLQLRQPLIVCSQVCGSKPTKLTRHTLSFVDSIATALPCSHFIGFPRHLS